MESEPKYVTSLKGDGVLIRPDGSTEQVEPMNGKHFQLEELQEMVDGYIELSETADGRRMVFNEEGLLRDLDYNHKATQLYKYNSSGFLVGNVLVCKASWLQ